jgi:hypothetical protein
MDVKNVAKFFLWVVIILLSVWVFRIFSDYWKVQTTPSSFTRTDAAPSPPKKHYITIDIAWLDVPFDVQEYRWYDFEGCGETKKNFYRAGILSTMAEFGFGPG